MHANDEGSAMSGYLWVAKNKKWKRLWFVVKGSVLYTYKASEVSARPLQFVSQTVAKHVFAEML